jgi:hypothetical protein
MAWLSLFLVREMGQVNAETDRVNIRRENT